MQSGHSSHISSPESFHTLLLIVVSVLVAQQTLGGLEPVHALRSALFACFFPGQSMKPCIFFHHRLKRGLLLCRDVCHLPWLSTPYL